MNDLRTALSLVPKFPLGAGTPKLTAMSFHPCSGPAIRATTGTERNEPHGWQGRSTDEDQATVAGSLRSGERSRPSLTPVLGDASATQAGKTRSWSFKRGIPKLELGNERTGNEKRSAITKHGLRTALICPVLLIAALLFTACLMADEPVGLERQPASEEIAMLIERLGAATFAEREAATKKLLELGVAARTELVRAKNNESAEVRSRALAILKLIDKPPSVDELKTLAAQPDDKLDLERGMWLIARIVDPGLRREELNKPLDALASKVRERLGKDVIPKTADPKVVVAALRGVLFDDEKFSGNFNDYGNPDNSSIARVLATRKGLPITLSHVVVAVGERLEVPLVGVPTPGRYIVKYEGRRAPGGFPRDDIFLNPFDEGKVLSREDREQMFPGLDPDDLPEPTTKRLVLIRMLNNLETHLFNRDEIDRAYQALAFRQLLEQHAPQDATP